MNSRRKDQICWLLKGIETGDAAVTKVVNEDKYIQHNPQTHEGSEGLEALFKRLSKTSPRVNVVRVFEDGDYVFAHTEYDFASSNIGFEIFRFEDDRAVEHWDNIQRSKYLVVVLIQRCKDHCLSRDYLDRANDYYNSSQIYQRVAYVFFCRHLHLFQL